MKETLPLRLAILAPLKMRDRSNPARRLLGDNEFYYSRQMLSKESRKHTTVFSLQQRSVDLEEADFDKCKSTLMRAADNVLSGGSSSGRTEGSPKKARGAGKSINCREHGGKGETPKTPKAVVVSAVEKTKKSWVAAANRLVAKIDSKSNSLKQTHGIFKSSGGAPKKVMNELSDAMSKCESVVAKINGTFGMVLVMEAADYGKTNMQSFLTGGGTCLEDASSAENKAKKAVALLDLR